MFGDASSDVFARPAITLFILAALALGDSATAHAAEPVTERFDYTITNEIVWSGPEFDIIVNGTGSVRQTLFFDQDGNLVRVLFQGRFVGSLTNSVTGETIFDAPSVANIRVDLVKQRENRAGLFFGIEVPGVGTVARDAGVVVVGPEGLLAVHGPHEVLMGGLAVLASILE